MKSGDMDMQTSAEPFKFKNERSSQ